MAWFQELRLSGRFRRMTDTPPSGVRGGPNPPLLVFDLDYTIWPYDCDKDVLAPFSRAPHGGVLDRYGRAVNDARVSYVGTLDEMNPVYGQARAAPSLSTN